jgi:transcriptional regulator with XRE-family HTH domain
MDTVKKRRRVVVDDSLLAEAIGARIKRARLASGLTQSALAGDRYTKAYISALEHGIAKPSMAALNYLAPRLGTAPATLIADTDPLWDRISADLRLAAGDIATALDGYRTLLEDASDRGIRAELLASIAQCYCRLDQPREAIRPATEAAELFQALGRIADAVHAEYWLASAHAQSDNLDEARAIVSRLAAAVRDGLSVMPDFRLRLLIAAAMIERSAGAASTALAYLEEARGLTVDLDDRRRGMFLATLADANRSAGDNEAAIHYGLQALALLRAAEAEVDLGHLENQLALSYLANGNAERAADLAHTARLAATARKDLLLAGHLAETEAQIALGSGDPEAAIQLANEAIDLADRSDNAKSRVAALITRARASAAMGDHTSAAADFETASGLAASEGPSVRRREVLSAWADSLAALGQHDRAFAVAREALDQR